MPLAPRTKLGPYEVLSLVGVGGMGEVYRARDPRLGRDVAINGVLRAVDILPGEEFRVGPPRVLGKMPETVFGVDADRTWTRSIAIVPAGKQPRPTIRIVLNWEAMVAKR